MRSPSPGSTQRSGGTGSRVLLLAAMLYAFLVSIGMLGKAFRLFSGGFVDGLIQAATNPLLALLVGILATTLVQSSSTTTSLVVALVGAGTMPITTAVFVVMGANIGTSVTNTLVSLGHASHRGEFGRAFAASTVHDFFNIIAVAMIFPLQLYTNFLGVLSSHMAELFQEMGGLRFASPLKLLTGPAVDLAARVFGDHPWMLMVASLALLFAALRYLVVALKSLVLERIGSFFDQVVFKNAWRAMLLGLAVTVLVQSSSITTSLVVPLAGAGILTLAQVFPYTLGTNVGTTITAILAALAVGEVTAVTVAFAHLLFNLCGIALIWPVPQMRRIPVILATSLSAVASRNRWLAIAYVLLLFYATPIVVILVLR